MRKIMGGVIILFACAVAMLALSGGLVHAQQAPDHHKAYAVTPFQLPTPVDVLLTDQFDTVEGSVENMVMFSPPVAKQLPSGEYSPILNPEDHLTWYEFFGGGQAEPRYLLVTNQFGPDQELTVGDPRFLLLPAWKMFVNGLPTGLDHPAGLDHYLCYDVIEGPPVGLDGVTLTDQFHQEYVTVGAPVVFCNPVEKTLLPAGPTYPIFDPENHLACYDIAPHFPPPPLEVWANDQFGDSMFMVFDNQFLCVPSTKYLCPDNDGDGYIDANCGGDDCNDGNPNIYPGNSNANCDCLDPIPQGTLENEAAGNCTDGIDNDCDGLVDTDPECTGGTCTGSAEASTYEASPVYGSSDLSKHLAYFVLPLGALIAIRIWRRKR